MLGRETVVNQTARDFCERDFAAEFSAAFLTYVRRSWDLPLLFAAGWWDMVVALGKSPSRQPAGHELDIPAPFKRDSEHGLFA